MEKTQHLSNKVLNAVAVLLLYRDYICSIEVTSEEHDVKDMQAAPWKAVCLGAVGVDEGGMGKGQYESLVHIKHLKCVNVFINMII